MSHDAISIMDVETSVSHMHIFLLFTVLHRVSNFLIDFWKICQLISLFHVFQGMLGSEKYGIVQK